MANHRQANVIFCDTDETFEGVRQVMTVRYIGAASGTAVIKDSDSSENLWEASGTEDDSDFVQISNSHDLRVEVTNGAKVYLYLGRH